MIYAYNFPNAYKEVYSILKYINEDDLKHIPKDFIENIKNKMNKDYDYIYNPNLELKEQKMLKETKCILAYIFLNYLADERQKEKIELQFRKDIFEHEEEKREQYSIQNLFNNNKNMQDILRKDQEFRLVKYEEKSLIKRILNKIIFFLRRNKNQF